MELQQDTQLQGTIGGTAGGVKLQERRVNYPLRRDGVPSFPLLARYQSSSTGASSGLRTAIPP